MKSRRLSAIMFTDIVDYSRLMGRDESAAMTLLENKEGIISPIITEFNGKIKTSEQSRKFRTAENPVLGYIKGNKFYIDLKAVAPNQEKQLLTTLNEIL